MHFISQDAHIICPWDGRQWFALTATARMCLLSPPSCLHACLTTESNNRYSTRHGQGTVSRDGDPARAGCLSWRSILFYTSNAVGLPPACLMGWVKGDEGGASVPCVLRGLPPFAPPHKGCGGNLPFYLHPSHCLATIRGRTAVAAEEEGPEPQAGRTDRPPPAGERGGLGRVVSCLCVCRWQPTGRHAHSTLLCSGVSVGSRDNVLNLIK